MALPLSAVTEVRADEDGRPVLVVRSEAPADDDSADNLLAEDLFCVVGCRPRGLFSRHNARASRALMAGNGFG
jgi:hypothetical protein